MDMFPGAEQMEQDRVLSALKIRALKEKINDETYLFDAIQRIALVLSGEIAGNPEGFKRRQKT